MIFTVRRDLIRKIKKKNRVLRDIIDKQRKQSVDVVAIKQKQELKYNRIIIYYLQFDGQTKAINKVIKMLI